QAARAAARAALAGAPLSREPAAGGGDPGGRGVRLVRGVQLGEQGAAGEGGAGGAAGAGGGGLWVCGAGQDSARTDDGGYEAADRGRRGGGYEGGRRRA